MAVASESVVDIIISQLGGMNRLHAFVGAYNFVDHGGKLVFRFKGSRKWNMLEIELDEGLDLYNLRFMKYSPSKLAIVSELEESGVYADMLVEMFERVTGLYLSF